MTEEDRACLSCTLATCDDTDPACLFPVQIVRKPIKRPKSNRTEYDRQRYLRKKQEFERAMAEINKRVDEYIATGRGGDWLDGVVREYAGQWS